LKLWCILARGAGIAGLTMNRGRICLPKMKFVCPKFWWLLTVADPFSSIRWPFRGYTVYPNFHTVCLPEGKLSKIHSIRWVFHFLSLDTRILWLRVICCYIWWFNIWQSNPGKPHLEYEPFWWETQYAMLKTYIHTYIYMGYDHPSHIGMYIFYIPVNMEWWFTQCCISQLMGKDEGQTIDFSMMQFF
jgi:hypothetical protein